MIPGPEFVAQVVELAQAGGRVHVAADPSFPALLVVRGDTLVVAHVGSAPPSFKVQEWLAAFSRVRRVETYAFVARGGMAPVEAVLRCDIPANSSSAEVTPLSDGVPPTLWASEGPPAVDECGVPAGYDDRGRRGD